MWDLDKLIAAVSKLGIIPVTIGWLAWELHTFIAGVAGSVAQQVIIQQQMATLLQRLIDLHTN